MSDSHPVPHARSLGSGIENAMGQRAPSREQSRAMTRYSRPEPHQKYELLPEEIPDGMDAMWLPTTIAGQPNREVMNYHMDGWEPATAAQVPRLSGYGQQYPESMLKSGVVAVPDADSPVQIDGLMLVFRDKELSARAHAQREREAGSQVRNQFARLRQTYRSSGGSLGIERRAAPAPRAIAPQQDMDFVEE